MSLLSRLVGALPARYSQCRLTPNSRSVFKFSRRPAIQTSSLVRPFSMHGPRLARRYARFQIDPDHPLDISKWNRATKVAVGIALGGGVYYVTHLEQVPETGRWRFMDISPKFEAKLAQAAHDELISEFRGKTLPPNHPLTRHVRRVVTRLIESSDLGTLAPPESGLPRPTIADGLSGPRSQVSEVPPEIGGRKWNLLVVNDDKIVNAAASYGNIIVFTGILPVAKDEQGLAAILGHEIGHTILRHNSERYSSMKTLLAIVSVLNMVGLDFGLARIMTTLLFQLPNSRTQELEADEVGLKLAAKACYDPRAAPEMFRRLGMLEDKAMFNARFISSHPPSEQRIKRMEELLPVAYDIQAANPECNDAKDSLALFRNAFANGPSGEGSVVWGWS